jgi:peptidoglycan/LPS O-acetylase OafA/YrhL
MTTEQVSANRFLYIDALRGIAALCVCIQHANHPIISAMPDGSALRYVLSGVNDLWFDLGRFGVALFFLISGFVIPFSLKGDHAVRRFAISRFFRLYPAYWLSMLAIILVTYLTRPENFTTFQLIANLTMAPGLLRQDYISGVYWTLFVELLFYAMVVALFAVRLLRNDLAIFAVGIGIVAVPLIGIALRSYGYDAKVFYMGGHISFLFAGYLLRMAFLKESRNAKYYAAILLTAILALMPLLAMQPGSRFTVSSPSGVFLAGLAATLTFVAANYWRPIPGKILIFLGSASYSIYLFHIPIGMALLSMLSPAGYGGAVYFALLIAGTLSVSAVVYRLVEVPAIAAGRKLMNARVERIASEVAL